MPSHPEFEIRRIYDETGDAGFRVLIDRLWPRGVKKTEARLDEWLKEVAPSTELRRWYGHDPRRFVEFSRRYHSELGRPPASDGIGHLLDLARSRPVTLLTATRDVDHSGAQVLHDHLILPRDQ